MPRLELFPLRYRDPFSGKWVRARYRASREDIAAQHGEFEITGAPEIREVDTTARYFSPWKVVPHTELMRLQEPPPEINPHLERPPAMDGSEAFLVDLFLRRTAPDADAMRR